YTDLADFSGYAPLVERATASLGVSLGRAGQVNAAYARTRTTGKGSIDVVSASYAVGLGTRHRVDLVTAGFADLSNRGWGVSLALSFPIGGAAQAYAQQGWRDGRQNAQVQLKGRGRQGDARLDWQVDGAWERGGGYALDAYGGWRGRRADVLGRVSRINGSTGVEGEIAQSLVLMGGRAFLTSPVEDGFTVVDVAGSPGVRVALENRTVGRTDRSGHILVTGLQPNLTNSISIDVLDLPIDASVENPSLLVAPLSEAGVVSRFDVRRARSAIVVLRLASGDAPPPGATVRLAGSDFAEPLGFGGEIYVRGLKAGQNRLDIAWREDQCSVVFDATVVEGTLPRLGPYTCAR
ncbi:MAG: fimbria/pilus outer membrane usher protein, partial [Caulobacter sp.]